MARAGGFCSRQLQRVKLVIVIGAQVHAIAFAAALGQPEHPREEIEARLRLVGEQLDVAEMGDVVDRFGSRHDGLAACSMGGRSVSSFSATPEILRVCIASSKRVSLNAASS